MMSSSFRDIEKLVYFLCMSTSLSEIDWKSELFDVFSLLHSIMEVVIILLFAFFSIFFPFMLAAHDASP